MIPLPLSAKQIKEQGNTGYFEIDGLYPGYGITIGNGLRRVLLSSLEGGAITEVKIRGVNHEFSTIPGVMEDVVLLLLNLKKLSFKCFSDEPQTISLKMKGEKEVKAKDFKLTSELELVNPNEHIAQLTKSTAELEIEAKVERGIGYEPLEKREKEKASVGAMFIDSIYSPVRKVSMSVENTRVGKRTDFDKLLLEIATNGVITPQEALKKATEILVSHFNFVVSEFDDSTKKLKDESSEEENSESGKKVEQSEAKTIKIEDMNIPERAKNAFLKASIKTTASLVKKTEQDLLELDGMGEKALKDVKKALKKSGLALKEEK